MNVLSRSASLYTSSRKRYSSCVRLSSVETRLSAFVKQFCVSWSIVSFGIGCGGSEVNSSSTHSERANMGGNCRPRPNNRNKRHGNECLLLAYISIFFLLFSNIVEIRSTFDYNKTTLVVTDELLSYESKKEKCN